MKAIQPLLIVLALSTTGCATAEDCGPLQTSFLDQLKQERFDAAETTLSQIDKHCPAKVYDKTRKQFTESLAKTASRWIAEGKTTEAAALIDRADPSSWAVYSVKGDLAAKQQQWRKAAEEYLEAYEILSDLATAESDPTLLKIRERIRRRAEEAQLVHGEVVAVATTRGDKSAQIVPGIERGVTVDMDIPVQFDTDSAKLNQAGINSAKILVENINDHTGLRRILVVGHTDERGEPDYNQKLSERRAETVAKYFNDQGIRILITTEGRGESEPKKISDEKRYNQEEEWAIQRRVQIVME